MTRDEVVATLKILKIAYPGFYSKMSARDGIDAINVWCEMFDEDDVNAVKCALYKILEEHADYPPTIADIKIKLKELRQAVSGEKTSEELWQILKNAVSNGYYGAKEEFEKLPDELKKFLGSPYALKELSQIDTATLNTVTKGQFLKQISSIRDKVKFERETPPEIMSALRRAFGTIPDDTALLTENEINSRRNQLLDKLER